jgi:hypothetical protein
MIKSFSAVAIATLVLVGCGGTGSGSETGSSAFVAKNKKAATIQGLKSFGNNGVAQDESKFTKVQSSYNANKDDWTPSASSDSTGVCESGSMTLPQQQNGGNFSFAANNCKNGATTVDGAVSIQADESQKSGTIEVTRDFTLVEGTDTFSIQKGSKVVATGTSLTANFQAKVNDEIFSASNLSVSYNLNDDAPVVSFNSGEINMGDYYFKFVEQVRPFTGGEQLTSGLLKLVDGAGHKVEIAVTAPDVVELRIDENGNGIFEASEIDSSFN